MPFGGHEIFGYDCGLFNPHGGGYPEDTIQEKRFASECTYKKSSGGIAARTKSSGGIAARTTIETTMTDCGPPWIRKE